jgi:hypothetical protein
MTPPSRKNAGRTIKRAVLKKYTQNKYRNYTEELYKNIRKGALPLHSIAIARRMRMFPVTTTAPLYRGVVSRKLTAKKVLDNGKLVNNSFSSFSYNRFRAQNFAAAGQNGFVIVLPPGRYPAINAAKFIDYNFEREVTLAPGTYIVNGGKNNKGNIKVKFHPK